MTKEEIINEIAQVESDIESLNEEINVGNLDADEIEDLKNEIAILEDELNTHEYNLAMEEN